ncbi:MAG: thioredoxin family protein [Simkaniaceae bacterium]|nr:thioredoxin family protein [Simkaniaceae bacterium]
MIEFLIDRKCLARRREIFFLMVCALLCAQRIGVAMPNSLPLTYEYDKGFELMKAYQKPALLCFLSTDECPWSKRLFDEVFNQPAFYELVGNEFIFVIADFASIKQQSKREIETNYALKEQFQIDSFPTLVMLNSEGEEIKRLSFPSKGRDEFAEKLKWVYEEYLSLVDLKDRLLTKPVMEDLIKAYQRALSLNTPILIQHFLDAGLKQKKNGFFLVEKYTAYIQEGKRDSEEAIKLRRKILRLKGDELANAKMRIAILDFQVLHESKPNHAIAMINRVLKDQKISQERLCQLNQLLAEHFIGEKEFLTARRFAEKLQHSDSAMTRHDGNELIRYIEEQKKPQKH